MSLSNFQQWLSNVAKNRVNNAAENIMAFKFNKKRLRLLSGENEFNNFSSENGSIVYCMSRSFRVEDNWSLLLAQKLSFKFKLPLVVLASLRMAKYQTTQRHFQFHLQGLKIIESELNKFDIDFRVIYDENNFNFDPATENAAIVEAIRNVSGQIVVVDFCPLRYDKKLLSLMRSSLKDSIPICQVDSANVLPCWIISEKLEYSARTLRSKVHKVLNDYLTDFPPVVKSLVKPKQLTVNDFDKIQSAFDSILDHSVKAVIWAKPGYEEAMKTLHYFIEKNLHVFNDYRNIPTKSALSNLSPWFRFGQVSTQRCILEVVKVKNQHKVGSEIFVEEALVRRELTDNYCYYQENYDKVSGAWEWAQKTLMDHEKDKKEITYTKEQMENAETGDDLWNGAQMQMRREGKMHGFLRMYWAKKILEWFPGTVQETLDFAIYLNDHYSLDGACPNGYVGIMWSICGVHDQGWKERQIFGKIRYMNYAGCKRKFNIDEFVAKYSGSQKKLKF